MVVSPDSEQVCNILHLANMFHNLWCKVLLFRLCRRMCKCCAMMFPLFVQVGLRYQIDVVHPNMFVRGVFFHQKGLHPKTCVQKLFCCCS